MSAIDFCGCCSAALLTRISSRPQLFNRRCDDAVAEGLASDVAGDQHALAARHLSNQPLRFAGIFMLVEISDDDVCSFPGKAQRHRATDAAIAAGDDGRPSFQFAAGAIAVAHRLGLRPHGRCSPGCFFWCCGGLAGFLGLLFCGHVENLAAEWSLLASKANCVPLCHRGESSGCGQTVAAAARWRRPAALRSFRRAGQCTGAFAALKMRDARIS